MLSALPTNLAFIQMTLTTKAGPPQASCWDLKALVLCLSAGPSPEGLDQKELGVVWTERLRGDLSPSSRYQGSRAGTGDSAGEVPEGFSEEVMPDFGFTG